jgi:hypothetical protein
MSAPEPGWEARYVSVVTERGHFDFFDRFVRTQDVERLVLVSPWVVFGAEDIEVFASIVHKIRSEAIETVVILRDPRREPINADAAAVFRALPTCSLYYNNELHAKVYVCRCPPFGFALVGSANLSGRGIHAYEVGLLVEGKGYGTRIVEELERVGTMDLPGRAGTIRVAGEGAAP